MTNKLRRFFNFFSFTISDDTNVAGRILSLGAYPFVFLLLPFLVIPTEVWIAIGLEGNPSYWIAYSIFTWCIIAFATLVVLITVIIFWALGSWIFMGYFTEEHELSDFWNAGWYVVFVAPIRLVVNTVTLTWLGFGQ